jgi:glutathione synthase
MNDLTFLYVADPIATFQPRTDSTLALLQESQRRGVRNFVCEPRDLWAPAQGSAGAKARPVKVRLPESPAAKDGEASSFFAVGDVQELSFDDVDVVWMRKDPPVDDLYLYATMLLERRDPERTLVLNDPVALRVVHEKLWALAHPSLVPPQVVSARPEVLRAFVVQHGKAVVKPLAFMGGMGVMVFAATDPNLKSAIDLLTFEGRRPALAQAYLPAVKGGDKRVIVIDGEPVAALNRVPQADDVRANLHAGGRAERGVIDDDDRRICAALKPDLLRLGIFFAGLDVIGGMLTEVNVTSPTGLPQINQLDGRSGATLVESLMMDRVFARCAARSKKTASSI